MIESQTRISAEEVESPPIEILSCKMMSCRHHITFCIAVVEFKYPVYESQTSCKFVKYVIVRRGDKLENFDLIFPHF